MDIAIIGTGYVGLVTGACLAWAGNNVVCIDADESKLAMLQKGRVPFHEPQLDELVLQQLRAGRLSFQRSVAAGAAGADIVFLAVGTPSSPDGHADLGSLLGCARELAPCLRPGAVVAVKSTVPVGTCERLAQALGTHRRGPPWKNIASNPEFLAEGRAVQDFLHPERIVVGADNARTASLMRRLYAPFDPDGGRMLTMDVRSAEFAKYACNAMLAARVSMVNELACLAGRVGADILEVCKAVGGDPRIGPRYLHPGAGYGGSCLPKDLLALIHTANEHGEPAHMLRSIEKTNDRQAELMRQAISAHFGHCLAGRCIAVWGLAFKPGTDDVRASPAIRLIRSLLAEGACVQAYDPVAGGKTQALLSHPGLALAASAGMACRNADALAVMTEWEEFRQPDFAALSRLPRMQAIFDGRLLYGRAQVERHGLRHYRAHDRPADAGTAHDGVANGTPLAEEQLRPDRKPLHHGLGATLLSELSDRSRI